MHQWGDIQVPYSTWYESLGGNTAVLKMYKLNLNMRKYHKNQSERQYTQLLASSFPEGWGHEKQSQGTVANIENAKETWKPVQCVNLDGILDQIKDMSGISRKIWVTDVD